MKRFDHFLDNFVDKYMDRYGNPLCTGLLVLAAVYFVCIVMMAAIAGRFAEVAQ